MNQVIIIDKPDYKLSLTVKPQVAPALHEVTFTRSYYNDGISANSSTFVLYLDQYAISKIINALQTTRTIDWSLANDDHR